MDIDALAQGLIDKHNRKTESLASLVRSTARSHYYAGVGDVMRLLKESALEEDIREKLTAPLAVSPSHAAVTAREKK